MSMAGADNDDWIMVPPDGQNGSETGLPVKETSPSFRFHLNVTLNRNSTTQNTPHHNRCPLHDQQSVTKMPLVSPDKPTRIAEQERSPLFALPVEIRLRIYEYLFQSARGEDSRVSLKKIKGPGKTPTVLSILSTCRRVLYEAEHIFYSTNQLRVYYSMDFLTTLGPVRRNAVSMLTIQIDSAQMMYAVLQKLEGLADLRSLQFLRRMVIEYTDHSPWRMMASQLVAQIEKLPPLEHFEVVTPRSSASHPDTAARKAWLDEIDERLRRAAYRNTAPEQIDL